MYTQTASRRALLAIPCALSLSAAEAATVVDYTFDDVANNFVNAPASLLGGVTAVPWQDADGTLASYTGNPGRALGARNFHDGNALRLALQVPAGFALSLHAIAFDAQASTSGPTTWSASIGGVPVMSGATSTTFHHEAATFMLDALHGEIEVLLAGAGASSALGTWRIDNFNLNGTLAPVPLPASAAMLAPALGLLASRRRRR